ncbi:MAG: putative immunity protein [Peptostreptococcaceae bacterium]
MAKVRKLLGKVDSPYIVALMGLIETQSKETIVRWCVNYAQSEILPIYIKDFPDDNRLDEAIIAANCWLNKEMKLADVKKKISAGQAAAKEAEGLHATQAAARAVAQSCATITTPTSSLALAFYGSAAVAYDRVGVSESNEVYDEIAKEVCEKMYNSLKVVAVSDEPKPAKINWNC